MKQKRLFRDGLVLLAFCGGFYLFLTMVGGLDGDASDDIVDFSPMRISADRSSAVKDWNSALVSLEKLIEKDPYDGRAQFAYARTYCQRRGVSLVRLGEFDDTQKESNAYLELKKSIAADGARALEEMSMAKKFVRYRAKSLLWLAFIQCSAGEFEESLKYLREFVDNGYYIRLTHVRGMEEFSELGVGGRRMTSIGAVITEDTKLHQFQKFWRIVDLERENADGAF